MLLVFFSLSRTLRHTPKTTTSQVAHLVVHHLPKDLAHIRHIKHTLPPELTLDHNHTSPDIDLSHPLHMVYQRQLKCRQDRTTIQDKSSILVKLTTSAKLTTPACQRRHHDIDHQHRM